MGTRSTLVVQTVEITADNVRPHDTLIGKDGTHLFVTGVRRAGARIRIIVLWLTEDDTHERVYEVAPSYLVTALALVECNGCGGSGAYYSGGHFENGRYTGHVGKCFRCRGTGAQNRSDVQRNRVYDEEHRRA